MRQMPRALGSYYSSQLNNIEICAAEKRVQNTRKESASAEHVRESVYCNTNLKTLLNGGR